MLINLVGVGKVMMIVSISCKALMSSVIALFKGVRLMGVEIEEMEGNFWGVAALSGLEPSALSFEGEGDLEDALVLGKHALRCNVVREVCDVGVDGMRSGDGESRLVVESDWVLSRLEPVVKEGVRPKRSLLARRVPGVISVGSR